MGNTPAPSEVETWDKGVWRGFEDKKHWFIDLDVFRGRDRQEVLALVEAALEGTPLDNVLVAVREVHEADGECESYMGLARCKGGFKESGFARKPLSKAVFA